MQLLIFNTSGIDLKYCLCYNSTEFTIFDYSGGYNLKYLGFNLNTALAIILLFAIFYNGWDYTYDWNPKYAPTIFNKDREKISVFIPQAQ